MAEQKPKNTLKIRCPSYSGSFLRVFINGREVKDLISLKVEVPSGKNTPLLKVRMEFYSALDSDAVFSEVRRKGRAVTVLHPPVRIGSSIQDKETES